MNSRGCFLGKIVQLVAAALGVVVGRSEAIMSSL